MTQTARCQSSGFFLNVFSYGGNSTIMNTGETEFSTYRWRPK